MQTAVQMVDQAVLSSEQWSQLHLLTI